jgi:hypothetical protein
VEACCASCCSCGDTSGGNRCVVGSGGGDRFVWRAKVVSADKLLREVQWCVRWSLRRLLVVIAVVAKGCVPESCGECGGESPPPN